MFLREFLSKLWRLVNREHSAGRLSGPMPHTSKQLHCLTSDAWNCDQAAVRGTFTSYYSCHMWTRDIMPWAHTRSALLQYWALGEGNTWFPFDFKIQFSFRFLTFMLLPLTHWGRVTHICVGHLTTIGSDNDLSPGRRQAITWTNVGKLLIWPLGTNFREMLIEIHTFLFKKIHLIMSSAKWRPSCLGLNVLKFNLCFDMDYQLHQHLTITVSYVEATQMGSKEISYHEHQWYQGRYGYGRYIM